jgi:hypothetical protein
MTLHILVINIKIKNSATCFGSMSHHQAKTVVPVHSVSAGKIKHSATCFGSLSYHQAKTVVLIHSVSVGKIKEPKHVAEFLIFPALTECTRTMILTL